jgi:hypothetical protein
VIYVDSSVILAELFTEDRKVPASLWLQQLVSSRLLEYEVWNRIHARKLTHLLGERTRFLIGHFELIEMTPAALMRALQPFPIPPRTLDTLHVATIEYLRGIGSDVKLASYDERMLAAARALHIPIYDLDSVS